MFRRGRYALLALLALASCSRPGERAIQRGNQAAQKGQYEAALKAWDEAVTKAPDDARALGLKGLALMRLGRAAEARSTWQQALELEKAQPVAVQGLALLALDDGDAGAAVEALDALSDADKASRQARLLEARALLARGAPGDAQAALDQAQAVLASAKDDPDAAYLHGSALVALGRYADAQAELEALQRTAPRSPLGSYGLARLAAAQGRSTDALLYLKSAHSLSGKAWAPKRVESDPAFAFLGQMPEFRALLEP